jgi:hypothetical protein
MKNTLDQGRFLRVESREDMTSVVLLTARVPSQLGASLAFAGYRVFEAMEVSEVLRLCEQEDVDVVVIGADVEGPDLIEVQMRRITLRLKPEATAKDVVWELSQLFPQAGSAVQ